MQGGAMRWRKLGRVFVARGQQAWMRSHAMVPIPLPLGGHALRVLFSPRDGQGRCHLAWLEMDLRAPTRPRRLGVAPLLSPGAGDAFDAWGAMGAWVAESGGEERLYYQGWTRPPGRPFGAAIGLATRPAGCAPDTPFRRAQPGPVLAPGPEDPAFVANPAVLPDGAGGWRMWYQSGRPWERVGGAWKPRYAIRHATSPDGRRWTPSPGAALDHAHPGEAAIARFCPLREAGGGWRAFYAFRGDDWPYRIGTAASADGRAWQRQDALAGIAPGPGGWEGESVTYPTVFDAAGARWMLYNAGRYGDAGFGLAVLE
ncbi:hypothetical protein ACI6QG_16615 [Roseococcus sp. DSY-14]|uniref:hypothetical protein n=1 Tax=Roseococcus sp. DSY-14 TaxID=3369650 RepID=UPI00387AEA6A